MFVRVELGSLEKNDTLLWILYLNSMYGKLT